MPYPGQITGLPKALGAVGTGQVATHRTVFRDGTITGQLAGGGIIDGSKSRDSGNTGDTDTLRPGLMLGKILTSGKYAPAVLGITSGAYTAGGLSLTVGLAQAVEIVRRVGASGTLTVVGPATVAGALHTETVTYSAADVTTGILTVSALGNNYVAGSFLTPTDGSGSPITFVGDGYGVRVTDTYDQTLSIDAPLAPLPLAGVIVSANLLPAWPSDASLQQWIVAAMTSQGGGIYAFSHRF